MEEITVFIRFNNVKNECKTTPDCILGDLLEQLSDRGILHGSNFVVVSGNSEVALDQSKSLEDNGIHDMDVLDVANPGKAG